MDANRRVIIADRGVSSIRKGRMWNMFVFSVSGRKLTLQTAPGCRSRNAADARCQNRRNNTIANYWMWAWCWQPQILGLWQIPIEKPLIEKKLTTWVQLCLGTNERRVTLHPDNRDTCSQAGVGTQKIPLSTSTTFYQSLIRGAVSGGSSTSVLVQEWNHTAHKLRSKEETKPCLC